MLYETGLLLFIYIPHQKNLSKFVQYIILFLVFRRKSKAKDFAFDFRKSGFIVF